MSQGQSSRQAKASKEGNPQDASVKSGTTVSLFSKILHPSSHGDWHKDEVVDVFWWLKQSAAILTGVALGYLGVTGWLGFVTFAAVQYLIANLWAQHAQLVGVCIEPFEVFTESAFVAAGTFVILWTLVYSLKVSVGGAFV
ncbi:rab5-interacting protein [Cystoisospora suis]|uniref:Rab5-interacting protein n=1 Tax=Cystoisospora suis TaxID=483139 RepID=A0A2C6LER2_9APIC|nr:rab5-interacting protein [Cystoisospora suis]